MPKVFEHLWCSSNLDCAPRDDDCGIINHPNFSGPDEDGRNPRNWNIFLTDRGPNSGKRPDTQRIAVSPVYSLSSPSLHSPTIYAGVEGQVIQLDMTSVYDRFPDPIFEFGLKETGWKHKDAVLKWDPLGEVMCLAMYEQVRGPVSLKQQAIVGEPGAEIPGWDERWRDL